jgi:hypothetical protein
MDFLLKGEARADLQLPGGIRGRETERLRRREIRAAGDSGRRKRLSAEYAVDSRIVRAVEEIECVDRQLETGAPGEPCLSRNTEICRDQVRSDSSIAPDGLAIRQPGAIRIGMAVAIAVVPEQQVERTAGGVRDNRRNAPVAK